MKINHWSIITGVLGFIVLVGAAAVGGERLLNLAPWATSSEHLHLAGEVSENKVAILENTARDYEREIRDLWKMIWDLDVIEHGMQKDGDALPPGMFEQRLQLNQERVGIENKLNVVREDLRALSRWSVGASLPRSVDPPRVGLMP